MRRTGYTMVFPANVTNTRSMTLSRVIDDSAVPGGSEPGIASRRRLGTCTEADQILAVAHTLILHKVLEEEIDIATERGNLSTGRQEGKHRGASIWAFVEIELVASDSGGRSDLGGAVGVVGGGDWTSAADGREPDHDFVLVLAGGGAGSESVVGDVGDEVAAAVGPGPGRRNGGDFGQLNASALLDNGVRVRLHASVAATGPAPTTHGSAIDQMGGSDGVTTWDLRGVPLDRAPREAINAGTFGASGAGLAPEVVVDCVRASNGGAILRADISTLIDGACWSGRS